MSLCVVQRHVRLTLRGPVMMKPESAITALHSFTLIINERNEENLDISFKHAKWSDAVQYEGCHIKSQQTAAYFAHIYYEG